VAVLLSGCVETGSPSPPTSAVTRSVSAGDFDEPLLASELVRLTNRERAEEAILPLTHRAELDGVADRQASYTALVERPDHFNPIPGANTVGERVAQAQLHPHLSAENAAMVPTLRPEGSPERAYSYAALAATIVDGWMHSPGHRANILNPQLTHIGCAARLGHGVGGEPRVFATQVFTSDLGR
jgi:uncharacterized protein YkwD